MTKTGNVEAGVTPSVLSGRRCDLVQDGEPLCAGEQTADPGLKKAAAALADPSPTSEPDGS